MVPYATLRLRLFPHLRWGFANYSITGKEKNGYIYPPAKNHKKKPVGTFFQRVLKILSIIEQTDLPIFTFFSKILSDNQKFDLSDT